MDLQIDVKIVYEIFLSSDGEQTRMTGGFEEGFIWVNGL